MTIFITINTFESRFQYRMYFLGRYFYFRWRSKNVGGKRCYYEIMKQHKSEAYTTIEDFGPATPKY